MQEESASVGEAPTNRVPVESWDGGWVTTRHRGGRGDEGVAGHAGRLSPGRTESGERWEAAGDVRLLNPAPSETSPSLPAPPWAVWSGKTEILKKMEIQNSSVISH